MAGQDSSFTVPRGLGEEAGEERASGSIAFDTGRAKARRERRPKRVNAKDRDWVLRKKERQRMQGKEVKRDSKYTARRRPMPLT